MRTLGKVERMSRTTTVSDFGGSVRDELSSVSAARMMSLLLYTEAEVSAEVGFGLNVRK